jgi:hypothetical protein
MMWLDPTTIAMHQITSQKKVCRKVMETVIVPTVALDSPPSPHHDTAKSIIRQLYPLVIVRQNVPDPGTFVT